MGIRGKAFTVRIMSNSTRLVLTETAVSVEVQHVALAALALEHAIVQLETELFTGALASAATCNHTENQEI